MDTQTPTQSTVQAGTAPQGSISPSQLHDPLLFWLKDKRRFKSWGIITGWGINLIVGFSLIYIFNHAAVPLSQLLGFATFSLIMTGTYLSLPSTMANLFNRLWENGVIENGHANTSGSLSYLEFVKRKVRWIHSPRWAVIALLGAIFSSLSFFLVYPGTKILRDVPLWFGLIFAFWTFVNYYVYILVLVWLVLIAVVTYQLFRAFTIRVKSLHPDGSGGLGPFNRLLWVSTPVGMIGGSIPLIYSYLGSTVSLGLVLATVMIYLLVAFVPLMAWLVLLHQAMVQVRNKRLQPLADEYERALDETMSEDLSNTAVISKGTERLIALQKRYEEIRNNFPTWPIEIVQLRSLVILLILPALLAILPLLINLFTKK